MRNPLLPVAALLAGGVFLNRWLWLREPEYLLAVSVVLLCALAAFRLGRYGGAIGFALLGTVLAGACSLVHWRHQRAPHDIEALVVAGRVELNEPAYLTGWIADEQVRRGTDEIYRLRLEQVESAQRTYPASGDIRLQHYRWDKSEPRLGLAYGDRVRVLARLRAVRGFHNPGSFDREARARREGTIYYASIKAAELAERLPERRGSWWMARVQGLRRALLARLDRLFPIESPANALLRTMLLGDRSGLDRRLSEDFQKTGTYHALVVSGLHTGAVAALLLLVLRRLRLPPFPATLLAIAGLGLYVLLTGGSIPTARAAAMFSLYLLARLVYRERVLLNTIAAAALLLLLLQPADATDAGFQLSFFSVLLIAGIAVPWIERTSAPYRHAIEDLDNRDLELRLNPRQAQFRIEMRMLRDAVREKIPEWFFIRVLRGGLRCYELLIVALVLQVGFLLPMAVYFHRAGWVSVAANLLIVPLLGIVVPLGLVTLFAALLSQTVAGLLAIPLGALVEAMVGVARWHAGLSLASLRVPVPPVWTCALFLVAALVLAAGLLRGLRVFLGLGAAALAGAALLITWYPFRPALPARELEMTALDVGQGDALVLLVPPGRVLVEDCGGLPGQLGTDTGEEIVSAYLWSRGIRRIDALAISHAHQDHIGGLESVLANFPVGELWMPAVEGPEVYEQIAQAAAEHGVPVRKFRRGERAGFGGASIVFQSPGDEYRAGRRAGNNDSLVMHLRYGSRSILLPGDVERKMEDDLLDSGLLPAADWLKVPHHGSKTSNSAEFLARVHAPYGVISVAENSPFGHPHAEALERLREAGVRVFRTDRDGAVTWATDGRRVRVNTYQWEHAPAAMDLW